MARFEHPVFGPERPAAARAAFYAMRNAFAAYAAYGWHSSDDPRSVRLAERLREACATRRMYAEYGDSVLGGV